MSYTLTLNTKQRLELEAAIASQQGRSIAELRVLFHILEKVRTSPLFRAQYIEDLPDGRGRWREELLLVSSPHEIDMESEELTRLDEMLDPDKGWRGFGVPDMAWVLPLRDQIRDLMQGNPTQKSKKKA